MYAGGFHGWAQLVADGVKFAQKEDVVPAAADRRVFQLAPAVALLPYLLVLAVIPVGPGDGAVGQAVDSQGIFFVLAVMGVGVLGSLMGGWASANKFSLLGGLRTAAQLLSYELPMLLAAASVAMAAGTVSLTGILDGFQWWWLPWQIIGALVFFTAGLAELQRPPFDMPVADSEIIFGAYTEYTGLRFALFLLAEYAGIVVLCALTAVLFLGGWHGPFGADGLGWLWTLLKTAVLAFVVIWLRVSYPRLREDQLQKLAWTTLVPLALAQIALTGIVEGGDQLMPPLPGSGLAKGLAVTLRTMTRKTVTEQYPEVQPELPPRSRGVIGLFEENCTVCMLCARECPDWCIYIDSHKETSPPAAPGGRERSRNVLDRFAIDFSLCMYCGICIEVCPFDALFWSPEFEYAETDIHELTHERDKLREWMWTVPEPPALDPAAEEPKEIAAARKAADKLAAQLAQEQREQPSRQDENGGTP